MVDGQIALCLANPPSPVFILSFACVTFPFLMSVLVNLTLSIMLLPACLTGILEMRTEAEKVKQRDGIMSIGERKMGDRNVEWRYSEGRKMVNLFCNWCSKYQNFIVFNYIFNSRRVSSKTWFYHPPLELKLRLKIWRWNLKDYYSTVKTSKLNRISRKKFQSNTTTLMHKLIRASKSLLAVHFLNFIGVHISGMVKTIWLSSLFINFNPQLGLFQDTGGGSWTWIGT